MTQPLGDVTYLAYQAVSDEELIMDQYADPEKVLDFLREENHFKTLSEQLKETMAAAGVCPGDADTPVFVDALYNRLVRQDESVGRTEKRPRNSVRRWLNGQFHYIRQRRDLIEICFALGLTLPQATELMNKCGFNGFNVRRAEDAVCMYCLLAGRPYSAALALLDRYESALSLQPSMPGEEPAQNAHSGHTTVLLEAELTGGGRWTDDETFLNTFLLPNKNRFIAYSVTALGEYTRLKNQLYLIAVRDWLRDEDAAVREKLLDDVRRERHYQRYRERLPAAVPYTEVSVTFGLKASLQKHAVTGPFWQELADAFVLSAESQESGTQRVKNNARDIFSRLEEYVTEHRKDPDVQEQASRILSDTLSADKVLFQILPSIIGGDDSRKRAYGDSSLKDTVLRKFPHRQTFTDFERNPADAGQDASVRKAVILMYYIIYAREYRRYLDDYSYQSPLFGEMGFAEFMTGLNGLLSRCRLSPLYPANQFDWLILRSIRELEISDPEEDGDSPAAFLNDVLDFSFGENGE